MSERIREILSWYRADNPGTLTNLARLLGAGRLGGTGRLLILPVDQGFEHGPARSFACNPPAYDPRYHYRLAIETGCSAYAAPLGFLEAALGHAPAALPLILKLNGHDAWGKIGSRRPPPPPRSMTPFASVVSAVGYTIYPGSARRFEMYDRLRDVVREAKARGLVVVVWAYPRGGGLSKEDETAIDVVAYGAHLGAELGAHVIKVKVPSARLAQAEAKKVYEQQGIAIQTPAERIRHVVQAAFAGRRIVIFSGGAAKSDDEDVLAEIRAVRDGGGFGTIMGRNTFQRTEERARKLLADVVDILSAPV